ncbi:hypothetical protein [Bacteroides helcogenes]|nr:hypothetical protein [Bacteroides helcogenes]MDY5237172.1 hypothetical protein [Bacteroides helcogenes]
MRTTTITLVLTLFTFLAGYANDKQSLTPDEKKLVGEYYGLKSQKLDNDSVEASAFIIMKSNMRYKSDRTYEKEGTMTFVFKIGLLGQSDLTAEYEFSEKGSWKIDAGFLHETADPEMKYRFVKSNAETDTAKLILELMKTNLDKQKVSIAQPSDSSKIVELTGKKLVIEQDGEKLTLTRKK